MARGVQYPDHIQAVVQFVEDTPPDRIVRAIHDKLIDGISPRAMLPVSTLAVVRP